MVLHLWGLGWEHNEPGVSGNEHHPEVFLGRPYMPLTLGKGFATEQAVLELCDVVIRQVLDHLVYTTIALLKQQLL